VDPDRLLIYGISFGSFWGTQVATVDGGVKGCAVAYVCHEPGGHTIFNMASPTFKLRFMYMAGIEDEDEFDKFAQGLLLDGSEVQCPYLLIAGEDDELCPIEFVYRLMEEIRAPKILVVYEGEKHSIRNPKARTMIVDWLKDRRVALRQPVPREAHADTHQSRS
jgi:dipeptidyl aminopeptidase/acylaminoacyl peptidase